MPKLLAPSLLFADFANLGRDVRMLDHSKADWLHFDVMDGVFVSNISFGIPIIKSIRQYTNKPLDIHLMIVNPDQYVKQFRDCGADILTVHYEACIHLHRTVQFIKAENMKAGVALNPHTSVSVLEDIICEVDLVCLMSVNPGFGGQLFIENTYKKLRKLKELIVAKKSKALIEIDGGITNKNVKNLIESGADVLVSGGYIFQSEDQEGVIEEIKRIM